MPYRWVLGVLAIGRIVRVIFQQLIDWLAKLTLGNSTVSSVMAQEEKVSLKRYRKILRRKMMLKKEFNESKSHLKQLHQICLDHISPVTAPVALISQIQRSGGSLLSQLFDGHPEIHAHPYELKIGYPKKYIWPHIDLHDRPESWFEILFEDIVIQLFRRGYKKGRKYDETYPFIFLPSLQREIFLQYVGSLQSKTHRDVFDAYMTSYFGAWLNNQSNFGQKKFVTAFTPGLAVLEENMESFFQIYPDGKLISIVRDPRNWYPSAHRHNMFIKKKYGNIEKALGQWNIGTRAALLNKKTYGERVCIVKFEDLVSKTGSVMSYLAEFLGIKFEDILLEPTFNKYPIRANTSFEAEQHGIMNSTLHRYKTLSEGELKIIHSMTSELYREIVSLAILFS